MDAFSDILTTIFVDKKHRSKGEKKSQQLQKISEKVQTESKESESSVSSLSSVSSESSESVSLESESIQNMGEVKRRDFRGSELCTKNLLITSSDFNSNLQTMSDILYKYSCMKDVKSIIGTNLNVITKPERKKYFKKLLIENPYLHFTNCNVKTSFTATEIKKITDSPVQSIIVIDNECDSDLKELQKLLCETVHIIVLSSSYDDSDTYKTLNKCRECMLIYKRDIPTDLQKRFYSNVVKKILKIDSEQYFSVINNDDEDVKYVYIKDSELFYN